MDEMSYEDKLAEAEWMLSFMEVSQLMNEFVKMTNLSAEEEQGE